MSKMGTLSRHWTDAILKEDRLRLRWYVHNEEEIQKSAYQATSLVTDAENVEFIQLQRNIIENNKRILKFNPGELPFPEVDESAIKATMRPVPKELDEMIYKEGRVPYLHKRIQTLPEDRYFFPETTSFEYGWKMWDSAKTMDAKRYGKSAIIRQSFYRRRAGIEKDPDWYRIPTRLSPTVCNYSN